MHALLVIIGFALLLNQNAFCKGMNLRKMKDKTEDAAKKAEIGNINTTIHFAKIKSKDCKDYRDTCSLWIRQDANACTLNAKYMEEMCMLSCRFCSPGPKSDDCKDTHPKCKSWGKKDCVHYTPYMKDICPKTCQLCGEIDGYSDSDTDVRCPDWGKTGLCGVDEDKMMDMCPYSCQKYRGRRLHLYRRRKVHHKSKIHKAKPKKRHHKRHHHGHTKSQLAKKPVVPLTPDEEELQHELADEWADEYTTRQREKAEQEKVKKEVSLQDAIMDNSKSKHHHQNDTTETNQPE